MRRMDSPNKCSYCQLIIDSDDFLNCVKCRGSIHTKCLLRPGTPGDLHGDVFFNFTCVKCSSVAKENFVRQDLSWFMVVTLALYNLSIRCKGLGRQEYFHYRTHICNFIAKNWTYLFNPSHNIFRQRKKKWQGTVAGVLSTHKTYFLSGYDVFGEPGWWKLAYNQTPKFYSKLYEQISLQLRNDKKTNEESYSSDLSNAASEELGHKRKRQDERGKDEEKGLFRNSDDYSGIRRKREEREEEKSCSRTRPYTGRKTEDVEIKVEISEESKEMNSVQSHLMDFLAETLSCDDLLSNDLPIDSKELLPLMTHDQDQDQSMLDLWNPDANLGFDDVRLYNPAEIPNNESEDYEENYTPRIVQVTNFQKIDSTDQKFASKCPRIKEEPQSEPEEEESSDFVCESSLFTKRVTRELPWKEEESEKSSQVAELDCIEEFTSKIELMSEYEEKVLHRQLKEILSVEKSCNLEIPSKIRRLYRKLCIRSIKRNSAKYVFNIDSFGERKFINHHRMEVLDRYCELISGSKAKEESAFYARMAGSAHEELFESPYTSRILHPYIYRHAKLFPPWLKIMCELQYSVNGVVPGRSTIDFCYVRPHHIAAINGLLQKLFWPGIDMSECLSYPDFSVVALYKKLIVGCAFLVPDVSHNEAYISFMAVRPGWQRSGIASFMLYHLTQTCMSKDITLHVAATNPAICLYQKFGFKIEEVILDFYEKYLPLESAHSRHAFFLRLKR